MLYIFVGVIVLRVNAVRKLYECSGSLVKPSSYHQYLTRCHLEVHVFWKQISTASADGLAPSRC